MLEVGDRTSLLHYLNLHTPHAQLKPDLIPVSVVRECRHLLFVIVKFRKAKKYICLFSLIKPQFEPTHSISQDMPREERGLGSVLLRQTWPTVKRDLIRSLS